MKSDHQKPVTLEDLLRLKRTERPPAEFWNRFDRELRAKQLAALVVKRPWWRTLPVRALTGLSRYHLPLGATAVLALTFLSVREYRTVSPDGGIYPVATDEVIENIPNFIVSGSTVARANVEPLSPAFAAAVADVADEAGSPVAEPDPAYSVSTERSSLVAVSNGIAAESSPFDRPSARSIAENFAATQSGENAFGGHSLLGAAVQSFESHAMPARAPVIDPLAQMKAPSDVRRSRYLGTALPVSANAKTATSRSSERLASRIADERLYESGPSRLGVGGDRLMVKF